MALRPIDPPGRVVARIEPAKASTRLVYGDLADAYANLRAERDWFATGIIEGAPVVVIIGPEKKGKSWLTLDLARAVAFGASWCGLFEVKKPGRVIYVDGENGLHESARRLARLGRGAGHEPRSLFERVRHHTGQGIELCGDPAGLEPLAVDAIEFGASLVILDPLRNVLGPSADENSTHDMQTAITNAARLRDRIKAPVVVLHHLNKDGGYAGARSLRTRADLILESTDAKPGTFRATGRTLRATDAIQSGLAIDVTHDRDDDDTSAATRVVGRAADEGGAAKVELSKHAERILAVLHERPIARTFSDLRREAEIGSGGALSKALAELLAAKAIQKQDGKYGLPTTSFFAAVGGAR